LLRLVGISFIEKGGDKKMIEKVKDPVCGMEVEEDKVCSEYQGIKYCFCSQGCKDKFDQNPTQYTEKHGGCCCG